MVLYRIRRHRSRLIVRRQSVPIVCPTTIWCKKKATTPKRIKTPETDLRDCKIKETDRAHTRQEKGKGRGCRLSEICQNLSRKLHKQFNFTVELPKNLLLFYEQ